MTSPERAGALQEAVEKALFDVIGAKTGEEQMAILETLYLSAQVSALESVAKELCPHCASGLKPHQDSVPELRTGMAWWHSPNPTWGFMACPVGPVWDALARLRAGSPEQAKEKP